MNPLFYGAIIKRERLRRNWSQEGLCHGICAVSYLSKIEQGKAEAGEEILRLLFQRLDISWQGQTQAQWDGFYEALFAGDFAAVERMAEEAAPAAESLLHGPFAPDFLLLQAFGQEDRRQPLPVEYEPYLEPRQLMLQRCLQNRFEEALRLYPCAYCYLLAGINLYETGKEQAAMEYLQTGYDLAAKEGYARLMLRCRMFMGNCCSNHLDLDNMRAHYRVAERLAQALSETVELETIRYNTASTLLESGEYGRAYAYFSGLKNPNALSLHKLAICCEKLAKPAQAKAALDRAQTAEGWNALVGRMCAVVRYRLEHENYLHEEAYGKLLMECFRQIRCSLPVGYAKFHLPWVLEYLTAARQYRQAYELLRDFPR